MVPRGSDALARAGGVACLAAMIGTHLPEVGHHLEQAPYLGVLFGGLIGSSLVLLALLVLGRFGRPAWMAAMALAFASIAGFVASRTIGLPGAEHHVGQWLETNAVIALLAEAGLVVLAASRRSARRSSLTIPAVATAALLTIFTSGAATQEALTSAGLVKEHDHSLDGGGHAHGSDDPESGSHGHSHHVGTGPAFGHHADPDAAPQARFRQAAELWRESRLVAARRFPTYAAARREGYVRLPRRWKRPLIFHLRHHGYDNDDHVLDARRPEALVYWWPTQGAPVLVGFMFRADAGATPNFGAPMLAWHRHSTDAGIGETQMTHVWMTDDLASAYANCLPARELERASPHFAFERPAVTSGHESKPCDRE